MIWFLPCFLSIFQLFPTSSCYFFKTCLHWKDVLPVVPLAKTSVPSLALIHPGFLFGSPYAKAKREETTDLRLLSKVGICPRSVYAENSELFHIFNCLSFFAGKLFLSRRKCLQIGYTLIFVNLSCSLNWMATFLALSFGRRKWDSFFCFG